MVILISGASHTGKTLYSQKLLEKYNFPYFSIDHLKMGLIRSGNTNLTPMSEDEELTEYLWPIVREMVKTAIENRLEDDFTIESAIEDNAKILKEVQVHNLDYVLIDDEYKIEIDIKRGDYNV